MKKQRLWMATIILMSITATTVFAGAKHHGGDERQGMRFKKMQQELQLTETQSTEIQALMSNHRTELEPTREKSRELRQEFRALAKAETFDQERARQLAQAQATLKVEMMAARHSTHQQVSAVLNPEQQARWETLRDDRELRRGKEHQRNFNGTDKY
jgi:Spy/CpxP family protein refolding chaperone